MTQLPIYSDQTINPGGGDRVASTRYQLTLAMSEDFSGLEEETDRFDLLRLVKRAGKHAGFTPALIRLLEYYVAFTLPGDWKTNQRPIVYQSVSRTALDLGVTERQIQKIERRLFELGAITWRDSGSFRRFGQRDPKTGQLLYGFGVDLTPLAYLKPRLEDALADKQLYEQAWLETKREITWRRRQIRSLLADEGGAGTLQAAQAFQQAYDEIAVQIRASVRLEQLRELLAKHVRLHETLLEQFHAQKDVEVDVDRINRRSPASGKKFALNKSTKHQLNPFESSPEDLCLPGERSRTRGAPAEKPVGEGPPDRIKPGDTTHGLEHVTWEQVVRVATAGFQSHLPLRVGGPEANDVVEAAYRRRGELRIGPHAWAQACQSLGRAGAAVCVLIADRGTEREVNPVRDPAAYFSGMVRKAARGELRLHASIYGLCEQNKTSSGHACDPVAFEDSTRFAESCQGASRPRSSTTGCGRLSNHEVKEYDHVRKPIQLELPRG